MTQSKEFTDAFKVILDELGKMHDLSKVKSISFKFDSNKKQILNYYDSKNPILMGVCRFNPKTKRIECRAS